MKIGFTGTRLGMTGAQRAALQELLSKQTGEFHHGGCQGADAEAHDVARYCGLWIIEHPPSNGVLWAGKFVDERRPKKPYLDRNRDIVDETEMLIATPSSSTEELRSGTWSTVRYARKLRRKIIIIDTAGGFHNGQLARQEEP